MKIYEYLSSKNLFTDLSFLKTFKITDFKSQSLQLVDQLEGQLFTLRQNSATNRAVTNNLEYFRHDEFSGS